MTSPARLTVAKDTVESFLLKLGLYGVAFVGSALISRALGPEGRGIYYFPVVAAATLVSVAKLGIEQANVYLLGTARVGPGRLSEQNGLVALVMGTIAFLALLVAPAIFPSLFSGTPIVLLVLAGLAIPFSLHTQFTTGLMTMIGQVTWQFSAGLIAGTAQVAVIVALYFAGAITPQAVLATSLLSITLTWLLVVAKFRVEGNPWLRWDPGLLGSTLRQSLPLHVGMVFFYFHFRADAFLVKLISGTTALGLYSVSVMLAETMYLAMDSLAVALLPHQVGNKPQEAAHNALRAGRVIVIVGGCVALLWVVLGLPIIRYLLGNDFLPAYVPMVILLPGLLALGVQRVCGPPILRQGRPLRMALIYALGLGVNVVLNLLLIPLWGIAGAATSSAISYSLGALVFLVWTAAIAGAPWWKGVLPKGEDARLLWLAAGELVSSIRSTASKPSGGSPP